MGRAVRALLGIEPSAGTLFVRAGTEGTSATVARDASSLGALREPSFAAAPRSSVVSAVRISVKHCSGFRYRSALPCKCGECKGCAECDTLGCRKYIEFKHVRVNV